MKPGQRTCVITFLCFLISVLSPIWRRMCMGPKWLFFSIWIEEIKVNINTCKNLVKWIELDLKTSPLKTNYWFSLRFFCVHSKSFCTISNDEISIRIHMQFVWLLLPLKRFILFLLPLFVFYWIWFFFRINWATQLKIFHFILCWIRLNWNIMKRNEIEIMKKAKQNDFRWKTCFLLRKL